MERTEKISTLFLINSKPSFNSETGLSYYFLTRRLYLDE